MNQPNKSETVDNLESNKTLVRNFLDLAFNQKKIDEAIAKYIGEPYVQHYATMDNGTESLRQHGREQTADDVHIEIKQILADGDKVCAFCHITTNSMKRGRASFELFRVKDGKLVEHWGIDNPVPEITTSGNSLF